jgi:uncharacterized repeat protein (TIGR04138 family)
MADITFEQAIHRATERDSRYLQGAYEFVLEALHLSIEQLRGGDEAQHVSGQELLEGVKQLALREFGPLAQTILNTWGLYEGMDVGNIVYNLIDVGYFGRSEGDSIDDFAECYDWDEAFTRPYLPKRMQLIGEPKTRRSEAA